MRREQSAPKRYSKRGWDLPSRALGHNVVKSVIHFRHRDGITTIVPSIPNDAETHRTYSMYIYNATIWTIKYDATDQEVRGGEDSSQSSMYDPDDENDDEHEATPFDEPPESQIEEESENDDDWVSMSFNHGANHVSYAGRRKQHWRLCIKRTDQEWARLILPDPYMAQKETANPRYGGLVGDLPLLIGLVALAVADDRVSTALPKIISEPWQFHLDESARRGDGCTANGLPQ